MTTLGTTAADALLSERIQRFRTLDDTKKTAYFYSAVELAAIRSECVKRLGEKEGRARFKEIRTEELGLGDVVFEDGVMKKKGGVVSKLLKVGTILADAPQAIHCLPQNYLLYLATAIERKVAPTDDLYLDAVTHPQRDFIEKYDLVKPRGSKTKRLICPDCGCVRDADDFEEAPHVDS